MKFNKEQTTVEWLPFENIFDNGLIKYKNSYIKIFKVNPINYDLKSNLEKESILNSYKNFLKTCDFDIQILIQSKKEDISKTISQIKEISENNEKINEIRQKYIDYIIKLNLEKNSSSKNFYIVIRKKSDNINSKAEINFDEQSKAYEYLNDCYFKIKETLTRCGNTIQDIEDKKEIISIFKSFIQ